ncbi:MAG TPA: sigma-70 family RNA polymerase sigma factor, partial [Hyphomicrobiales bacterium]|nr:sigma-70 family RNA polymerase sigma factor [Hyphomicrobiales bacterium]
MNLLRRLGVIVMSVPMTETEPDQRDRQLIERIVKHDSAALRALYTQHNVRLFRFLIRLTGNETVAEDVVNETFMKVWTKAASYGGKSSVSTWLFTIARNEAISILRKKQDADLDDEMASQIEDESDTQETTVAKADKGAVMRQCIDKLST